MKRSLVPTLLLCCAATHAAVIKCPESYPHKPLTLSGTSPGHEGSGILRGASLSAAHIYTGELYGDVYSHTMQVAGKKVKGGEDIETGFTPQEKKRWLVCVYGGNEWARNPVQFIVGRTEWWEKIDEKFTHCVLQIREIKNRHRRPSDWMATAVCK